MKKIFLSLAVGVILACGSGVQASETNFMEKVALYIPNRIVDAFDCFSVTLGVGPVVSAQMMITHAAMVGGSIGMSNKLYKDYNRQYGIGVDSGWYWSLVCVGEEDLRRDRYMGLVKSYWEANAGVPAPTQRVYDLEAGARDYWKIGGTLGAGIEGEVYIHPIEGFDFILGFFFLDFKNDDLTFADFE